MTEWSENREEAFDRVVHEYYQAIENGNSVDPKTFIEDHPEFRDQLRSFFADLKNLGEIAGGAAMPRTAGLEQTRMDGHNADTIRPGSSLTYIGNYRILEEIARGGMGVVFKARQEKLHRTVALKMILSGRLASEAEIDRFQREACAAAGLKHPNIVGVHEIGIHQGHHYFTMDYIESMSLSERLREGSFAPREAARLAKLLATATHYAHEKGVLHRDLKPANILIDASGQPHITDFGLAKSLARAFETTVEEITRSGQIVGTPSYMSPEQAAAKHQLVSVSSDVYSLGAILYACLSGRAPFVAESTVETLRQVINDDPLPTRMLNHRVPKDLETICLKCLAKEPHRRYGTANELADDLQRFQNGQPVVARPISGPVKVWRWCRRNTLVSSLAATVAAFLIVVSIVASAGYKSTSDALADSEKQQYYARILSASELFSSDQLTQANQQLEACPQHLRHLEWHVLSSLGKPDRITVGANQVLSGLSGWRVGRSLSFANDGSTVSVIMSHPYRSLGKIRSFDATSGEMVSERDIQSQGKFPFNTLTLGYHCEKYVALHGCIYDRANDQELLRIPANPSRPVFSPDTTQLAYVSHTDNALFVLDIASGAHRRLGPIDAFCTSLVWSADGQRLASAHYQTNLGNSVYVWDVPSGRIDADFEVPRPANLPVHAEQRISSLAFNPHGTRLAAGLAVTAQDAVDHINGLFDVTIWDLEQEGLVSRIRADSDEWNSARLRTDTAGIWNGHVTTRTGVDCLSFAPDGEVLAVGCVDCTVKLFRGTLQRGELIGHESTPSALTFAGDGTLASMDSNGAIKTWSLWEQGSVLVDSTVFDPFSPRASVQTDAAGSVIAASVDRHSTLATLDLESGDTQFFSGPKGRFLLSRCGEYLAIADVESMLVKVLRLADGAVVNEVSDCVDSGFHTRRRFTEDVMFNTKKNYFAARRRPSGSRRSLIEVHTLGDSKSRSESSLVCRVVSKSQFNRYWLLDNDSLATVEDGGIVLRQMPGGVVTGKANFHEVVYATCDVQGSRIVAFGAREKDEQRAWYLVDAVAPANPRRLGDAPQEQSFYSQSLPAGSPAAVSPDGGLFAYFHSRDEVRIRDLTRNEHRASCLLDTDSQAPHLLWSSDGRRIFIGNSIFDPNSGRRLLEMSAMNVSPLGFPIMASAKHRTVCYADSRGIKEFSSRRFRTLANVWTEVASKDQAKPYYNRLLEDVNKMLKNEPNNPRFRAALGAVQYRLGHLDQAAINLTIAINESWESGVPASAMAFLAMSEHRLGRRASAAKHLAYFRRNWCDSLDGRQVLLEAERLVHGTAGEVQGIAGVGRIIGLTADEHWLVRDGQRLQLIARTTGATVRSVDVSPGFLFRSSSQSVKVAKGSKHAAALGKSQDQLFRPGANDIIQVIDMESGDSTAIEGVSGSFMSGFAFSPDGSQIAILSHEGTMIEAMKYFLAIHSVKTGQQQFSSPCSNLGGGCTIIWEGNRIACCGRSSWFVWDVEQRQEILSIRRGATMGGPVCPVSLSDSADFLAVSRADSIEIWNVAAKKMVHAVQQRRSGQKGVRDLAFYPNSDSVLASSSDDEEVCLWDMDTGTLLGRFPIHEDAPQFSLVEGVQRVGIPHAGASLEAASFLAFDPNAGRLIFGSGENEVHSYAVGDIGAPNK